MQLSTIDLVTDSAVSPRRAVEIQLLVLYVAMSLTLVVFGPGGIARIVFLGGAALLGFVFCARNPPLYISFVLWLWFLTPFARRLVDHHSGWVDSDPILAASLLATLACFPKVCRHLVCRKNKAALPFVLAMSAVAYGCLVGVFFSPLGKLLIETARWTAPILFGLFLLFEYADSSTDLADAFERTFKWGLLVMGVYSIVQYTMLPAWDALWMTKVENPAFGTAEPFDVRVFSTMASPVPLGVAAVVGLILLMRQRGSVSMLATIAGYACLALCRVRSTWGLWVIGTALILFRQKQKPGRFLFVTAVALSLVVLSTSFQPVQDTLQKRFQTLSDLDNDGSFQARTSGYEEMVSYVLSNPFGAGLGAMETVLGGKSELGGRDSGILDIVLSLGWVGGAVYFFALVLVCWYAVNGTSSRTEFETAASVISITIICHIVLSTISADFAGLMLWSFAGISIASHTPGKDAYILARATKSFRVSRPKTS